MSSVDDVVEFGAELSFEATDGRTGRALLSTPALRTASRLTLVVTEAHERSREDVRRLLGRILDDRAGLFEAVHIDYNRSASSPGFEPVVAEYVAASDWGDRATSGVIDSYYDYDASRLLVTPDRYPDTSRSNGEAEVAADTPAETSEGT